VSASANNTAIREIHSLASQIPADTESSNRTVALSVATNVACMGMAGVASILAARLLGPEGRGQFAEIVVWTTLASALGDLGISQSCSYYSAKRPHQAGIVVGTAVAISLFASTLLLAFIEPLASRIFGKEMASAARFYLFSVPLSMVVTCLTTMMLGLGLWVRFNLIKTVQAAGYMAGIGCAWARGAAGVEGFLMGILTFQILAVAVALGCAATAVPLSTWGFSLAMAREHLSYGLRTYAGSLFWFANGRLDQVMLAWLAPIHELGTYAVAVSYSGLLFGVSGAIATMVFSRVARAGSGQIRRQEIGHGLILLAALTLPLAAVMALLARYAIVRVYGSAFANACLPACILLLGSLLLGVNYVLSNGMRADGRPGAPSLSEVGGLVVTVLALPIAIPRWGITGAAWVSVASYAMTTVSLTILWMLHRTSAWGRCSLSEKQTRRFGENF
jgi:O-antigen/teichoic acid export membrane protein